MEDSYLFASESVSEGQPDKMADQISDAILDEYLSADPDSLVACECVLTGNYAIIAGEVHSYADLTPWIPNIVKRVVHEIGYDSYYEYGPQKIQVKNFLHFQSHEIRKCVHKGVAADQGLMFGYACNETPVLMPYPIYLANRIMERHAELRKSGKIPWLLPDAKSQVTVVYSNGKVTGIDNIVVSTQYLPEFFTHENFWSSSTHPQGHYSEFKSVNRNLIGTTVEKEIISPLIDGRFDMSKIKYLINGSESFQLGGPLADTGLTGRKVIVDTYGGSCPHGGGAFSGKDATKVDRSGAYMARYLAKNIVASGLSERCKIQLAYAIGIRHPVSFMIDFMGTGKIPEHFVREFIEMKIDLTPQGIIERLNLKAPIFRKTAAYGHFGRELPEFRWEQTDLVGELLKL